MALSGLVMVWMAYGLQLFYLEDTVSAFSIVSIEAGSGGTDGLQYMSHFFLAWKYKTITRTIPAKFRGEEPEPESTRSRVAYYILLWVNILSIPFRVFGLSLFRIAVQLHGVTPTPLQLDVLIPVSFNLTGVVQIVTGCLLIYCVWTIQRFFKERGDEGYIDTAALCRHATCFGSYLLISVVYYTAFTIFIYNPTDANYKLFTYVELFYVTGLLLTELLLAQIFWNLGTKQVQEAQENQDDEIVEVEA
jgi:hypothetical protein